MLIIYVIDMTANENVKTCFSSFGYANSDFLVGYALLLVKKKAKRLALVGLRVWLFFFLLSENLQNPYSMYTLQAVPHGETTLPIHFQCKESNEKLGVNVVWEVEIQSETVVSN